MQSKLCFWPKAQVQQKDKIKFKEYLKSPDKHGRFYTYF